MVSVSSSCRASHVISGSTSEPEPRRQKCRKLRSTVTRRWVYCSRKGRRTAAPSVTVRRAQASALGGERVCAPKEAQQQATTHFSATYKVSPPASPIAHLGKCGHFSCFQHWAAKQPYPDVDLWADVALAFKDLGGRVRWAATPRRQVARG